MKLHFNTLNEIILGCLYTTPIVFCVFISNLFFCMFRWYNASVPLVQNLLINVLFSHLSYIWQAANIICATYLLTHLVFHLENPMFSWILIELRRFQMVILAPCLVLVSVSRFLAHFKANLYIWLQHRNTGIFTSCALILVAFVFSSSVKMICQSSETCFKPSTKTSFFLTVIIVLFFNVAIVLDIILKASHKIPFMFPQILPFHGSVSSDPERMEIPTISSNVQEPSNPVQKPETHEHIAFSTGLLTILMFTLGSVIISRCAQYFAFQMSSSSQGYIISLVLTTIIPIYWTLANKDLKGFAVRTIKNWLPCGN
jgi:hypothetical protein